jgi:hypothetical protein
MQLIEDLRNDPQLRDFICQECQENGIALEISTSVDSHKLLIIKPDDYYNSLRLSIVPPSPDCLIVQNCTNNRYVIYVVELKNIGDMKNQNLSHIREKFQTCLQDFMSNRFRTYFYDINHDFLNSINLYFIARPNEAERYSKDRTTRLDSLLALPPCEFANRKYLIKHKIPNPVVQPC